MEIMGIKLRINLSALCTRKVEREARELRKANALQDPTERKLPDGSVQLRARACDPFNFVDRPVLVTNPEGTRIREYRCDCPDYTRRRTFCEHCAALALAFTPEQPRREGPVSIFDMLPLTDREEQENKNEPVPPEQKSVEDLSYAFCNAKRDLYPGQEAPRIPLSRYFLIFGANMKARALYQRKTAWGGSCSGFTATSALLTVGDNGVDIRDFSPEAARPAQLRLEQYNPKLSLTLHEFIEAAQLLQYSPIIYEPRQAWMKREDVLERIAERVASYQATGKDPVTMSVYADKNYRGGHAVFPFRFERKEGAADILHIYDPNCPLQTRFGYFEKDPEGRYVNWRFQMNNKEEYSGAEGGLISMTPYDDIKKVWDIRGTGDAWGMLSTEQSLSVMNAEGDLLASVTDQGVVSHQDDIYQIPLTDEPEDCGPLLQLPEGNYLVRNDEPEKDTLTLTYTNAECSVKLNTAARMAEIMLRQERELAYVEISQPECPFSIEFETMERENVEQVKLEGVTGLEPLCFVRQGKVLYGTGIAECDQIRLCRNGTPVADIHGQLMELVRKEQENREYETNVSDRKEDGTNP